METDEELKTYIKATMDAINPLLAEQLYEKNIVAKIYLVMFEVDTCHEVKLIAYQGRTVIPRILASSERLNWFPQVADTYLKHANILDTGGLMQTATINLVRKAQEAKKEAKHEEHLRLKASEKRDELRRQYEKEKADAKEREATLSRRITSLTEQLNEKTKEAEHFKELYGKLKAKP